MNKPTELPEQKWFHDGVLFDLNIISVCIALVATALYYLA